MSEQPDTIATPIDSFLNYSYFRERLENPELLERAVPVFWDLAVPVGGARRSGHCGLGDDEAVEAFELLEGREGFPDLRLDDSWDPGCLSWGEPVSHWREGESGYECELRIGLSYGYRLDVVTEFVDRMCQEYSSPKKCRRCGELRSWYRDFRRGPYRMKNTCIVCEANPISKSHPFQLKLSL